MTRFKAFAFHFICSLLIAASLAWLVFFIWYPDMLDKAVGVRNVFGLVLVVDSILGPFLTLLVYKKGKRYLELDLAIIVLVQISALAYGLYTVAAGRPQWVVFNKDRFDVIQTTEVLDKYRPFALPEYQLDSWIGPRWVAAVLPEDDPKVAQQLLIDALTGGADLPQRLDLYRPLGEAHAALEKRSKDISELYRHNPKAAVENALRKHPQNARWLPLNAREESMVVLLDENQKVIDVLDLRPWD